MRYRATALAALATAALALGLTACGSSDDGEPAESVPAYKVTEQDKTGNSRTVTVQVDSAKGLHAVFDDVTKQLEDEAGYFVHIDCSTGGTKKAANRLATGRYAVGNTGAAVTGRCRR